MNVRVSRGRRPALSRVHQTDFGGQRVLSCSKAGPALSLLRSEDRTEVGSGVGRLLVNVENDNLPSPEPVNSTIFILNIFLNTQVKLLC